MNCFLEYVNEFAELLDFFTYFDIIDVGQSLSRDNSIIRMQ